MTRGRGGLCKKSGVEEEEAERKQVRELSPITPATQGKKSSSEDMFWISLSHDVWNKILPRKGGGGVVYSGLKIKLREGVNEYIHTHPAIPKYNNS